MRRPNIHVFYAYTIITTTTTTPLQKSDVVLPKKNFRCWTCHIDLSKLWKYSPWQKKIFYNTIVLHPRLENSAKEQHFDRDTRLRVKMVSDYVLNSWSRWRMRTPIPHFTHTQCERKVATMILIPWTVNISFFFIFIQTFLNIRIQIWNKQRCNHRLRFYIRNMTVIINL